MASTLSTMRFYAPISSPRINIISSYELPPLSSTKKAMAGQASPQRAKEQQLQPKIKGPQASPVVLLNQFPVGRTVQQMMDTMEKIMDEPLVVARDGNEYGQGKLPWAIKEGEKDYKMRFNMPGMNKNDVKVWIEENMLVVKAEKVPRKQHDGPENGNEEGSTEIEDWPAQSYGRYSHRIALPENIEFEKINAQVKDGVLYITIPKTSASGKIIDIHVQ